MAIDKEDDNISFTKFQRICEDHVQDEATKVCFCNITGKNCNKIGCPKENEEEDAEM